MRVNGLINRPMLLKMPAGILGSLYNLSLINSCFIPKFCVSLCRRGHGKTHDLSIVSKSIFVEYLSFSREWTENGQLWVQQVSSTPATRLDVVNLQVLTVRLDVHYDCCNFVGNLFWWQISHSSFAIHEQFGRSSAHQYQGCKINVYTVHFFFILIGTTWYAFTATTGKRDRNLSCAARVILPVFWCVQKLINIIVIVPES